MIARKRMEKPVYCKWNDLAPTKKIFDSRTDKRGSSLNGFVRGTQIQNFKVFNFWRNRLTIDHQRTEKNCDRSYNPWYLRDLAFPISNERASKDQFCVPEAFGNSNIAKNSSLPRFFANVATAIIGRSIELPYWLLSVEIKYHEKLLRNEKIQKEYWS